MISTETQHGSCPHCGLRMRLENGRIRWHRIRLTDPSPLNRTPDGPCEGTGKEPAPSPAGPPDGNNERTGIAWND